MRITLVEASSLKNILTGESKPTLVNSDGKAVIFKLFEDKPSIKLVLQRCTAEAVARTNARNTKRYVGVSTLEVDFYSSSWNDMSHLTVIYALHPEAPHSRIYIVATPHKIDPEKLTRELMQTVSEGKSFETEYPILEIKQAPHRRFNLMVSEAAAA